MPGLGFNYEGEKPLAKEDEKLTPEEVEQVKQYIAKHPEENQKTVEDMIRVQRNSQETGEE